MPNGYYVPTSRECKTSDDCPSLAEFDNAIDLDCFSTSSCRDDDLALSSGIAYARFGEDYEGSSQLEDGHVRRAVPVAYCRTWNDEVYWKQDPAPPVFGDFAYCVLTAPPDVEPVPVMMHCEADQYLSPGTPVGRSASASRAAVPASSSPLGQLS